MSLDRLRYVRHAQVYKAGALAGHLKRGESGELAFTYAQAFNGPPIASTLPVSTTPVTSPGGGLPPFFAGLLPEGHRLTVLRRATKTSLDDELTLLMAVGNDVPGDVQIVPAGEAPDEPQPLADGSPEQLDFAALAEVVDGVAIPGVQTKISASMVNTPLRMPSRQAILKLDPPEHPHLVLNEAAHLQAAKTMNLPVAQSEVVKDRHGLLGLLVDRFDRVSADEKTVRLAMEDAAQLMNIFPAAKYQVTSEAVVWAVLEQTRAKPLAARNLYLQFLFAWLTGNGDLHAKNVSVLDSADRGFVVAPLYDVPCTLLYGDSTMALSIAGRTSSIKARHWAEFADSIGLPQAAAKSAQALAIRAASQVELSDLPFEGSPLDGTLRELRHRRGELERSGL